MRGKHSESSNHCKDIAVPSVKFSGSIDRVDIMHKSSFDHAVYGPFDVIEFDQMCSMSDSWKLDNRCIEHAVSVSTSQHDGSEDIVNPGHINSLMGVPAVAIVMTEGFIRTSMWNFEEGKVRVQFLDAIQDWCSCYNPSVNSYECPNCQRGFGGVVFDVILRTLAFKAEFMQRQTYELRPGRSDDT